MNNEFYKQASLLVKIAPIVFDSGKFALKGGTAINLFLRNMPRLSVDFDCVFIDSKLEREAALSEIRNEFESIGQNLQKYGLKVNIGQRKEEAKCVVSNGDTQVKIEVNIIFRGTIFPIEHVDLCKSACDLFMSSINIPLLNHDEIYAGKILAALDRQHPRDLFDIYEFFNNEKLTESILDCFSVYLASHNRPMHEVLCGEERCTEVDFNRTAKSMIFRDIAWEDIAGTRKELQKNILKNLTENQKEFLLSIAKAQPKWECLSFGDLSNMPAVKWKLNNLKKLRRINAGKFEQQERLLRESLYDGPILNHEIKKSKTY